MQQWGHGVGGPVHDQQLRAGFLRALGWAGMRTLTLTVAGASRPPPPAHPLTSPRLGVSALKAFSLARTAWASWAVSSGPLGGDGQRWARGSGVGGAKHRLGVKDGARARSQVTG